MLPCCLILSVKSSMRNGMNLLKKGVTPLGLYSRSECVSWILLPRYCLTKLQWRPLTSTSAFLSGHNRWSKIRHDKGAADAARAKAFSIISKDITTAVQQGGPDPSFNPRLTHLITNAKKSGFAKSSIETAILKGQNKSASGLPLEQVTIEAMLPGQVACVIDCLTENKNRALANVRHLVTKFGGNITSTGFLFEKKGRILLDQKQKQQQQLEGSAGVADDMPSSEATAMEIDQVLDLAIESGALDVDVSEAETTISIDTAPSSLSQITQSILQNLPQRFQVTSSEIIFDPIPDMMVDLDDGSDAAGKVERILDAVRDDPSVQEVYLNAR